MKLALPKIIGSPPGIKCRFKDPDDLMIPAVKVSPICIHHIAGAYAGLARPFSESGPVERRG